MSFNVTRDRVHAYAAVVRQPTNELPTPDGSRDDVPLTYFMATSWSDLVLAGTEELERRGVSGAPLTLVHYQLRATRPLVVGDAVATAIEIVGFASAPGGAFLTIRHDTYLSDGERLAEQRSVVLIQGLEHDERNRNVIPRPEVVRLDPLYHSLVHIESAYPQRFAEVSGDENPIHLDRAAAITAGFSDVVVHGMGLLARCLESEAVRTVAESWGHSSAHPIRAFEVSCQFGRPAHPGDVVNVRASPARLPPECPAVAFGAATPRGAALKQGLLVFDPVTSLRSDTRDISVPGSARA